MGEVYRTEDSKVGCELAIKALPEVFDADPERLGRFEREAAHVGAVISCYEDTGLALTTPSFQVTPGAAPAAGRARIDAL